jgi:hypothetical protein
MIGMTARSFRPPLVAASLLAVASLLAACGAPAPRAPGAAPARPAARAQVATGVQIYRWNGASWSFVAPDARLYADAGLNGLVGTHFSGPTWLTVSGSQVVGTVALNGRCVVNATAVPWLKLDAVASGTGVFEQTTLIQRVNTVGGVAPDTPGTVVGEEARVPYTADYYFYRTP